MIDVMHMNDKLSMFRSKHNGIIHKTVTIIITIVLKLKWLIRLVQVFASQICRNEPWLFCEWKNIISPHRSESVWLKPNNFDKICGPRSPITTKYVMHEPNKNPIEHSSIISLPDEPNMYDPVRRTLWEMISDKSPSSLTAPIQWARDTVMQYTYRVARMFFVSSLSMILANKNMTAV